MPAGFGDGPEAADLTFPVEPVPSNRNRLISPHRFASPRAATTISNAVIDKFHPDIVHVHTPWNIARAALRASAIRGIPSILTVHLASANITEHSRIARAAPRVAAKLLARAYTDAGAFCVRISAPSDTGAINAAAFFPHRRLDVISNGVSVLPKESGCPDRDPTRRLLYVGRLAREKRVDLLLRAVASPPLRELVRLDVVGDGQERKRLETIAMDLRTPVHFTGHVTDAELSSHLAAADVFCMPSDTELECIAVLEALDSGKPVVAPRGSAIDELATDDVAVMQYAPASSAAELADAILRAMSVQEDNPRQVAERCRALVAHRALDRIGAEWMAVYREVTERGRPAARDELMRADLAAHGEQNLETTLKSLAELRATLPEIDGIVLARDARAQLEHRGDS